MPDPSSQDAQQAVARQHSSPPPSAQSSCRAARSWVEISLVDVEGNPVPNMNYRVKASDGEVVTGKLDGNGFARIQGIQSGTCAISFPDLDREAWEWI